MWYLRFISRSILVQFSAAALLAVASGNHLIAQGAPPAPKAGSQSVGVMRVGQPQFTPPPKPTAPAAPAIITIHIRQAAVTAEVARNEAQREHGLMDRYDLPDNSGMLFVLPKPEQATFWMKDTKIPLSIAYMDHDGTILEIYDMQAEDLSITGSKSNVVCYALEMNVHWFDLNGIHAGDKIDCSPHSLAEFPPQ